MSTAEIVDELEARGHKVRLDRADRVVIDPAVEPEVAARLRPRRAEIVALLRGRDPLANAVFTHHSYLCRRCKCLGRVAVISGEITCSFCIVAEAERLATQ